MTLAVTESTSNLEGRGLLLAALLLVVANLFTLFSGWLDSAGLLILGASILGILLPAGLPYPIFAPADSLLGDTRMGDSVPVATVEVVTQ